MKDVYEIVTGQIMLAKREEFFRLHSEILLPTMREYGIRPFKLLLTEIGDYGAFLDIYHYESLAKYDELTGLLVADHRMEPYYREVGLCVDGSIRIQIMTDMPYSEQWEL